MKKALCLFAAASMLTLTSIECAEIATTDDDIIFALLEGEYSTLYLPTKGANYVLQNNPGGRQDVIGYPVLSYVAFAHHLSPEQKADIQTLIAHGADVNKKGIDSTDQNTALMIAVQHYNVDLVKLLLQNGADKNLKNKEGKTP